MIGHLEGTAEIGVRRWLSGDLAKVSKPALHFRLALLLLLGAVGLSGGVVGAESVSIVLASNAAPRIEFGASQVAVALRNSGLEPTVIRVADTTPSARGVLVGTVQQPVIRDLLKAGKLTLNNGEPGCEGFVLATLNNGSTAVVGGDDSGALYGCLELAKRIRGSGKLPTDLRVADKPAFVLRGTCIGMQKPYILPGRHVYEYPYTPELFPWFYDKALWNEYLDFLVRNRMNTLYLWNGHPFASLVRLKDYPYAVEVPEDVFEKNVQMFHWLTRECDKRGIWLVQMFYNIIVSKPFAEHNEIRTQLSAPTPLVADYTRKSIAEFVKQYPHVGLLVCLGEALRGTENQIEWCTNAILPGVLDGMKATGLTAEPPVVIRTHAMDGEAIMPVAFKVYTNLYTMTKYNGESLTTWQPRGKVQALHLAMSKLGPHIVNVHILSNLEPFRYGDQDFIRRCVLAARDRLGASGIHLYPLCYWNWPYSPDATEPPLLQWRRDWIWFQAWARYSWNPEIPEKVDHAYWIRQLAEFYGNTNAAADILAAYDQSGECAPRLIRWFGITEGNRQTLSLGMTLDQLVNPQKYGVFSELWLSQAPPGERLQEYVEKEWLHRPHEGETPPQIIREVLDFSKRAVQSIDAAAPRVTKNRAEFERLGNDVRCVREMSEFYASKATAAMHVLRYKYSGDIADMQDALTNLDASFRAYESLAALTKNTYRFANSMQTSQRKIPVTGGVEGVSTNYHWVQLVRLYRKELEDFRQEVMRLKAGGGPPVIDESKIKPWPGAPFKLISTNAETYKVERGARVWTDRGYSILSLAPELRGLTGIRFSHTAAKAGRYVPVEFEVSEPVRVLIGYFQNKRSIWLQVPNLETAAQADERGGVETILRNAATIEGSPGVDVHAFRYGPGRHKLEVIGQGSFVVLGVVPQSAKLEPRDAHRGGVQP